MSSENSSKIKKFIFVTALLKITKQFRIILVGFILSLVTLIMKREINKLINSPQFRVITLLIRLYSKSLLIRVI